MMIPEITEPGRPIADADLRSVEARLGCVLPDAYTRFLTRTNGGSPEPYLFDGKRPEDEASVHYFLSIDGDEHTDLVGRTAMYRDYHDVPRSLLPIAATMSGDAVCVGIAPDNHGQVWFWSHDHPVREEATWLVADDFDAFLSTFHRGDELTTR